MANSVNSAQLCTDLGVPEMQKVIWKELLERRQFRPETKSRLQER